MSVDKLKDLDDEEEEDDGDDEEEEEEGELKAMVKKVDVFTLIQSSWILLPQPIGDLLLHSFLGERGP